MANEYEQHVERRARAAYEANHMVAHGFPVWEDIAYSVHVHYCKEARATMESDDAAGYALVPREATEAMANAHQGRVPSFRLDVHDKKDAIRKVNAANAAGDLLTKGE